jgi:hypothetical protein
MILEGYSRGTNLRSAVCHDELHDPVLLSSEVWSWISEDPQEPVPSWGFLRYVVVQVMEILSAISNSEERPCQVRILHQVSRVTQCLPHHLISVAR